MVRVISMSWPRGHFGQHHLAIHQHVEARSRLPLAEDQSRLEVLDPAVAAQPGQLLIVELLEQEQRLSSAGSQTDSPSATALVSF